jgi:tetratricopeptide (TPR) repeat protein
MKMFKNSEQGILFLTSKKTCYLPSSLLTLLIISLFFANVSMATSKPKNITDDPYLDASSQYMMMGNYERALVYIEKSLEARRWNSKAYYQRGLIKAYKGEHRDAINDFDEALRINQRKAEAYIARAHSKMSLNYYRGALQDYRAALRYEVSETSVLYSSIANAKLKTGDFAGAIHDLTKAIDLNPENARIYFHRGNAKMEVGDYRGALNDFIKATEIISAYTEAHFQAGNAYFQLRNYDQAIEKYTTALSLNAQHAEAYFERGKILINHRNNIDNGCLDLSRAGELGISDAYNLIRLYCR